MNSEASSQQEPSTLRVICSTTAYTLVAYIFANTFLSDHLKLAAAALITFSLRDLMLTYLDQNRRQIWSKETSAFKANETLTLQFVRLFSVIFVVTFALCLLLGSHPALDLELRYQNTATALAQHNLQVLAAFFTFALIYREAGILFILSWNALHWATSIAGIFLSFWVSGSLNALMFVSAIVPHLFFEALSYVLAGMAGTFISKASSKYEWLSSKHTQVLRAAALLLLTSCLCIGLAVVFEYYLAQAAFWNLLKLGS